MKRPWTLRRRLTIVVGLIILIVSASIAVTVSLATRRNLIETVDESLLTYSARPIPPPITGDPPLDTESFQPFALIRFDRDGRVVMQQPSGYLDAPEPLPDVSGLTLPDLEAGGFLTLGTVDESGSVRALIRAIPEGSVLLAESLDETDATARQAVAISLAVSAGASLLGIALAWLLLRRAFRPVDAMIATAGAIGDGDLTKRTDVVESTTELGRLATALDHMLARIEAADRDKLRESERLRRFVDDASHELRTPLAAIAGYAELYVAGGVEPGPGLDRAMARINEASDRAGLLLEDLLSLARLDRDIGSGRVNLDLCSLAEDIVEDSRVGTGRDITCESDGTVTVNADPVWLRQAIENLINNAVSHGGADTPVKVRVRRSGSAAEVAVIDHGPGIAVADRELVFDRFARPDAGRDRKRGGAGLGLAIVREVVASHEGSVVILETPGGGATVQISMPLSGEGETAP